MDGKVKATGRQARAWMLQELSQSTSGGGLQTRTDALQHWADDRAAEKKREGKSSGFLLHLLRVTCSYLGQNELDRRGMHGLAGYLGTRGSGTRLLAGS